MGSKRGETMTRDSQQSLNNLLSSLRSFGQTEDEAKAPASKAIKQEEEEEETINYQVGDHVYTWISFLGVPFAMQQHGIVVHLEEGSGSVILMLLKTKNEEKEASENHADDYPRVFYLVRKKISLEEARESWHKIPYSVHWSDRMFTRAGTANPIRDDPVNVVLHRVGFLWNNQDELLVGLAKETTRREDVSECIVVWCKTGAFHSFHGLAKMGHHGVDLGSSATLAGGICSQVVASSFVPILLPVFVVYDIVVALKSAKDTHSCQQEWNGISSEWNEKFALFVQLRQSQRVSQIASQYSLTPS